MKQLLTEQNKEFARLAIKRRNQGGKLNSEDSAAFEAARERFNARAVGNRKRQLKGKHIDWESGKDARAEGHIARATVGVKKARKGEDEEAARAHGHLKDWKRLDTTGSLINEGPGWLGKLVRGVAKRWKGRGARKMPTPQSAPAAAAPSTPAQATRKSSILGADGNPVQVKVPTPAPVAEPTKAATKAAEKTAKAAEKTKTTTARQGAAETGKLDRIRTQAARSPLQKLGTAAKRTAIVGGVGTGAAATYHYGPPVVDATKTLFKGASDGVEALKSGGEAVENAAKAVKTTASEFKEKVAPGGIGNAIKDSALGKDVNAPKPPRTRAQRGEVDADGAPATGKYDPSNRKGNLHTPKPPKKPLAAKKPPAGAAAKREGGWLKDKNGNWTTGAKVAGAVGGAYVAKKTYDAFKSDK